ncbi:MAG TPA: hypothetical protein VKV02_04730 [Acidobacteriaceae bacterium]|nr:hypothetical protein [Acidobacteriaceae bacterium]
MGQAAQGPPAQIRTEASAFAAARAVSSPEQRIAALQSYLQEFPSGAHSGAARDLLLQIYLLSFPDQREPIHALATAEVMSVPPGFERWEEQARVADTLAGAEPAGADLEDAQQWAQSALASLTEAAYRREMAAAQARYKLPRLTAKEIHAQYLQQRTMFLAAAAHVDLQAGKLQDATTLLDEASALHPLSPEVNALRGQLALAEGRNDAALAALERADAMGGLDATWRAKELALFQASTHGDSTALQEQIDSVYRNLYPPAFQLPRRQLPPGGHTALLEIFTGSGCAACAGVDQAANSLLASYAPQDLALIEFDEHIPRPDPLANPDSVARAAFYGVEQAPQAFLDGQEVQVLGSSRQDVENIVVSLADVIEDQAALPSSLTLQLATSWSGTGVVTVQRILDRRPAPNGLPETSLRALARAMVFTALVEDNVRYSGENGIRFHRMVVRSLQSAPAANLFGAASQAQQTTFDIPSVRKTNDAYLAEYETTNDRFGAFQFASPAPPLEKSHLAVVVWVQDPVTRRVLQAAFAPVSAH